MERYMQRFHGTAARQLVLIDDSGAKGPGGQEFRGPRVQGARSPVGQVPRIRLLQKDMYAELARRRRRAQLAARRWVDESRTPGCES